MVICAWLVVGFLFVAAVGAIVFLRCLKTIGEDFSK